jgi:ADP-heptose:LPS heptosyltransferase
MRKMIYFVHWHGLGDIICETPTIRELHLRGYEITLYVSQPSVANMLRNVWYVENLIEVNGVDWENILQQFVKQVRRIPNYREYVLYLRYFTRIDRVRRLLRHNKFIYSVHHPEFDEPRPKPRSRIEIYADELGLALTNKKPEIAIYDCLPPLPNDRKNIGITVGSHPPYSAHRRRDFHTCLETCRLLSKEFNVHVMWDYPKYQDELKGVGHVYNVTGLLDWTQFVSYLRQLDCHVTPDTGALHTAMALNIPVITWMGPSPREKVIDPAFDHLVTDLSITPDCTRSCARFSGVDRTECKLGPGDLPMCGYIDPKQILAAVKKVVQ